MKIATKFLIAAICSLTIGIAFASPLLISELAKPFPVVPEGPKAEFSVEIVYADFSIQEGILETTETNMAQDFTRDYPYINVTYMVVLNVTNLADIEAKLSEVSFSAAENITVLPSALGGYSFERSGGPGVNFGGVVKGIWLDNNWLNVTWMPGTEYPSSLFRIMTPQHITMDSVPDLPDNATETGPWVEGVPVAEYYSANALERTEIYINGAWVDVTGRVRPDNAQPMVMSVHTLASRVSQNFGGLPYRNAGNASVGPVTELPGWKMYNGNGPAYRWINASGFSNVWTPGQSRLIMLNSTVMQTYSTESQKQNLLATIAPLVTGEIDLYASASSYLTNWLVEGTYYNTYSTATYLTHVAVENTGSKYVYNTALAENQIFQSDKNGVEVFIAPRR
jgi:hypothetical protein